MIYNFLMLPNGEYIRLDPGTGKAWILKHHKRYEPGTLLLRTAEDYWYWDEVKDGKQPPDAAGGHDGE